MAFSLPPLPYAYNALEPHIDEQTMRIHHDKHHATYVTNLNAALEPHPDLQKKSIEELIAGVDSLPEAIRTPVRNNGGGHANHTAFWEMMAPGGANEPGGALAAAIGKAFGGLDKFKEQFAKACTGRFGSGWAGWSRTSRVACPSRARRTRTRRSWPASARSSAATCGSTPTTSSIRTGVPTMSPRGGTWSTGPM